MSLRKIARLFHGYQEGLGEGGVSGDELCVVAYLGGRGLPPVRPPTCTLAVVVFFMAVVTVIDRFTAVARCRRSVRCCRHCRSVRAPYAMSSALFL